MFDLVKQNATVAHLNIRDEKHGDDSVLAMDVKFTFDSHNSFLNKLYDGLQDIFYMAPKEADPENKTVLKIPQMASVSWAGEILNAIVVIHGDKPANDLALKCKVNKLKFECLEGGTVKSQFRAQVLPDPDDVAKLSVLLNQEVKISVSSAQAQLI